MKLTFIIDKKYDKEIAKILLPLKRYTQDDIDSMNKDYKNSIQIIEIVKKEYQKSWNKINDEFFEFVQKITGYEWNFKNYECVISVINPGYANWGGANKFLIWWKFNSYFMRRIVAHELLIHHYFEIYRTNYKDEKLTDEQIWALAEVAAYALTSLPRKVNKFWPWSTHYFGSYLPGTAYPQLDELRKQLKEPFLKRKNFDEYIKKGIELIKKKKGAKKS